MNDPYSINEIGPVQGFIVVVVIDRRGKAALSRFEPIWADLSNNTQLFKLGAFLNVAYFLQNYAWNKIWLDWL